MSDPEGKEPREYDTDHKLVNDMANHMFKKMRLNKHKAHWSTVSQEWLFNRLIGEVDELMKAVTFGDGDVISECADVANFAAMIADNHSNEVV